MPGKNLWPEVYGAWSEISRHLPGPVPQFIPACYQNDPPKSWTPRPILHSLTLRTAAMRHLQAHAIQLAGASRTGRKEDDRHSTFGRAGGVEAPERER